MNHVYTCTGTLFVTTDKMVYFFVFLIFFLFNIGNRRDVAFYSCIRETRLKFLSRGKETVAFARCIVYRSL